ncbi:MAG: hypothetical protein KAW89_05640 [Armatimonadetes bacterium]|nr:hypothetical protein [Armatimonadota bacterium]
MHELIDLGKFELALQILAAATLPAGLIVGTYLGRARGAMRNYMIRGAAVGLLGPIIYVLWRYYRWMVRLAPESGYVGLHRPGILALNVGVFIIVGAILGLAYTRIFRGDAPTRRE